MKNIILISSLVSFVSVSTFATKDKWQKSDLPSEVVQKCSDSRGRLANAGEKWEPSDAVQDSNIPQAHIVRICKSPDDVWEVECEKGGFALQKSRVKALKRKDSKWSVEDIISLSSACSSSGAKVETLKLSDLKKLLKDPRNALQKTYDNQDNWNQYLDHISSGDKEWVATWPKFKQVSDAGASEMLDIAMGQLISKNAEVAFKSINDGWSSKDERLNIVKNLCGPSYEELPEDLPDVNLSEIQKKMLASSREVKNSKLKVLAEECISTLKQQIQKPVSQEASIDSCLDRGGCWDHISNVCRRDEPNAQALCNRKSK